MTKFTPKQGDYFEIENLTEVQFKKLVDVYRPYCKEIAINDLNTPCKFVGWGEDGNFDDWYEVLYFGEDIRLLTYSDVFAEAEDVKTKQRNIDWEQPIETQRGGEAFVLKAIEPPFNEKKIMSEYLVTYRTGDGYFTRGFYSDGRCTTSGLITRIRNKPELIKPEGWVAVYEDGLFSRGFERRLEALYEAEDSFSVAVISYEELISGKFKDGIPKGYGLGDQS